MVQGQDELRIMVQIGCRCPPEKQDAFLERVRGFGAREVPAKWHEELMAVRRRLGGEEADADAAAAEAVRARARARCKQLLMTE
jgi:hypothetical protein